MDMVQEKERDEGVLKKQMGQDPESSNGMFELQEPFEACSHSFIPQERDLMS